MSENMLKKTMQIGIVIHDLDAAKQRYENDFGVGPWNRVEFDGAALNEYGQPVKRSWRGATARVGEVMWELIKPLDEQSVFARFLSEKGSGVHHIAVATPSYDQTLATHSGRKNPPVLQETFEGLRAAYLDTAEDLGVLLEISDLSDPDPKRDSS